MSQARRRSEKKCLVQAFQKFISGKHKIRIIWNLKDGPMRYNEIRRGLLVGDESSEGIDARVLSRELKQLCELGLLFRKDFGTLPPKVEYSLTEAGLRFLPVIEKMHDWGTKYL